jgi:hypothetical protein
MSTPIRLPPAILLVDDDPDIRLILSRMLVFVADGYELSRSTAAPRRSTSWQRGRSRC